MAFLAAHGAQARLTVNRSIAGIGLGMSAREVHRALGPPSLSTVSGGLRDDVYRSRKLVVTLSRSRVVLVATRSRRERTAHGIGVGSSARQLRAGLKRARCGVKAGVGFCRVGSARSGRRSTTFLLEAGRVITVTVGRGL